MKKIKKQILCVVLIIVAMPYIFSIIINGRGPRIGTTINDSTINVNINGRDMEIGEFEYIVGVLANEIPRDYPLEGMKAQAVIIRTRLYRDRQDGNVSSYAYLDKSEIIEKWKEGNIQERYEMLEIAVSETDEMVIIYEGGLIVAPYHVKNAGSTVSGEEGFSSTDYPYLQSVECGLDSLDDEEIVGHGMGLSQNTTKYMALEGKSYEEILFYFYKGVELTDSHMEK